MASKDIRMIEQSHSTSSKLKLRSLLPDLLKRSPSVRDNQNMATVGKSLTPIVSKSHSMYFTERVDIIGTPGPPRKQVTIHTNRIEREEIEDDLRINEYVVKEVIGQGSFGLVRKAVDGEGKSYAMKIVSKRRLRRQSLFLGTPRRKSLSPQRQSDVSVNSNSAVPQIRRQSALDGNPRSPLANIYREIAILKKINHDNIVKLHEVLDDPRDDELILVFEFIERGALMELPNDKKFTEDECRNYFVDLILGLEFLHSHKVIHRDIKPSNLLLGKNGKVKISDFGVSEEFSDLQDDVTLSHSAGTPAFMAPETLDTEKRYFKGKASDIWASGVTLYCMVFGQLPFISQIITELHERIRHQELEFPEGVLISPDLEDLLSRLLEKNPDLRISIPEIRDHPWIKKASIPMKSKEENCSGTIEINDEDLQKATTKASFPIHVLIMIKKMAKQKSFKNPFSSSSSSPVPERKKSQLAVERQKAFATKQMPTIEISGEDESYPPSSHHFPRNLSPEITDI